MGVVIVTALGYVYKLKVWKSARKEHRKMDLLMLYGKCNMNAQVFKFCHARMPHGLLFCTGITKTK